MIHAKIANDDQDLKARKRTHPREAKDIWSHLWMPAKQDTPAPAHKNTTMAPTPPTDDEASTHRHRILYMMISMELEQLMYTFDNGLISMLQDP